MEEKAKSIIKDIIENLPFETEEISFSCEGTDQTLWCLIKTKEPHLFIGRNGESLGALNYLARRMVEKAFFNETRSQASATPRIIIDVNDYQKKKIENLKTLAHMLSERAQFFKSSIEADPMPPLDRKVIHEFLSEKPNIKTESVGVEPKRRVVIRYTEEKSIAGI